MLFVNKRFYTGILFVLNQFFIKLIINKLGNYCNLYTEENKSKRMD